MFGIWFINLVQVDEKWSIEEVEKIFNQFSIEERGKFNEETLVNVNNIRKQSARSKRSNGFRNEYIVVSTFEKCFVFSFYSDFSINSQAKHFPYQHVYFCIKSKKQ